MKFAEFGVCLYLLYNLALAKGANILVVSLLASPSHFFWNKELSLGLIRNGHNVTMLSHNKDKVPMENFTILHIDGIFKAKNAIFVKQPLRGDFYTCTKFLFDYCQFISDFDNANGKDVFEFLLNYPKNHFDLIMWDISTHQFLYPIIEKLGNPPVVAISAFGLQPYMHAFGHHNPAYTPMSATVYTENMTFTERMINNLYMVTSIWYRDYVYMEAQQKLANDFFGENTRPLLEIEQDFLGLILTNNDPLLDYPQALPPTVINIGGLQVKPAKPLEKDILKTVQGAKHGIILFSLGSNIKSEDMTPHIIQTLLKAFSKLKQTVLWKFGAELPNLPSNVVINKWLPQNDILGHPNTKLFITHGGSLSTHETIYHGVPVICLPFFLDQITNAKKMTAWNLGKTLDFYNLTAENVYNDITEVLENPIYVRNIKERSRRYRDQPQTPLQRGVFWIEYVLRHGDVKYLNLPSKSIPYYVANGLDVLACLIATLSLILFVIYKLSKCVFGTLCKSNEKQKVL